jgi:membrane-associated HD superfamily phosphohydrolase
MNQLNGRRVWVWVLRLVFGLGLIFMLVQVQFSSERIAKTDVVVFESSMALVFLSLWWKRIYMNALYDKMIALLVPATMFIASWLRHGRYTSIYGSLTAFLVAFLLVGWRTLSQQQE